MMKISIQHEIPFHDVDSMSIVWHGHYYKYFELARTALYRSCKLDVNNLKKMKYVLPVIESHCRYAKPLNYGEKITVTAQFKTWQQYLWVDYEVHSTDLNQLCASGHTKQAVCNQEGELFMRVPDEIVSVLCK